MDLQITDVQVSIKLILNQPRYPHFEQHLVRYESFKYWSSANKHRPVSLAQGGMYYSQISDFLICFCCGGGIRNLTEQDDIWVIHARLYGDCDHLKYWRDRNFIYNSILRNSVMLPDEIREFESKQFDPTIYLKLPVLWLPHTIEQEVNKRLIDRQECSICMDELCNAFFMSCGHQGCLICLHKQFQREEKCHLCRQTVFAIRQIQTPHL